MWIEVTTEGQHVNISRCQSDPASGRKASDRWIYLTITEAERVAKELLAAITKAKMTKHQEDHNQIERYKTEIKDLQTRIQSLQMKIYSHEHPKTAANDHDPTNFFMGNQ